VALFGQGPVQWERLQPGHIQAFVARYGSAGCTAAARVAAISLRNFLRWLQLQGRIDPSLVAVVPTFRRWRHTALPQPLTNDQYEGVLATFDRSGSVGLRDYCIVTCMGDLGLRCAEVADLMLGDWDESARTLRIVAGKTRRGRVLPVPTRIRKAIIAYIRGSRPSSTDQHLFLRHRTPAGVSISRSLIRGVIGRAFAKIPGFEGRRGTHLLRHTAATRLHQAGADLKRVADILGHMSVDTTAIYAKVDRARLSAVALPWPATGEVCS
jgi:integrase